MGSGPYRVKDFEPGRYVTYERVSDWWAADLPIMKGRFNFDEVRYDYYRDQVVALEAFKAGRYDFRLESSSKDWATQYNFPARREGRVKILECAHSRPSGMQAFAFNLRREKFANRDVRLAIAHAFDFEWSNKRLFYGQYTRTTSYFENSDLASRDLPDAAELRILEPLRGRLPEEVFTKTYQPPKTDGSGNIRRNLRSAQRLLKKAGWRIVDNRLVDKAGKPFEIEFLLVSPAFERVVIPFVQNLKRLGIEGRVRTVDSSQYQTRLRSFDYDMIVTTFGQSRSPGNEQRDFWSAASADREGGRNLIGIRDPAIDSLVEKIVAARTRTDLITATRALDRVLLWNHFVIPQWHIRSYRLAWWDKFGIPDRKPPYGVGFWSWWVDPAKEKRLTDGASR
jgi:microcin C transport system substrate-binding protein